MDAKKHNDLTKLVSKGDAKEIEKVMRRGGADASNLAAMMAKAKANATKRADAYGALTGGTNLGLLGATIGGLGAGVGGGISGAYSAPKGQKLRGALRGAGRGLVQGGLIGGGVGAGTGAVLGGHVPLSQMIANAKLPAGSEEKTQAQQAVVDQIKKINPTLLAGLTTAGGVGGGVLGSYLAHEATRPDDEEDHAEKAKQAELKLSPNTGIKTPNKHESARNFNTMIEQARRNREAKEKRMRAMKEQTPAKAASAWPRIKQALGNEFTDDQLKWAPLIGAGVGGAFGLTSKKNKLRNALIGAITGGGAGLGAQYGYKNLVAPLNTDEKAMRALVPVVKADQAIGQWFQSTPEQMARNQKIKALENYWHMRGLAGGLAGAAIGTLPGSLVGSSFPEEQDDDPVWAGKNKKKKQASSDDVKVPEGAKNVTYTADGKVQGYRTDKVIYFRGERQPLKKKQEQKTAGSPILGGGTNHHYLNKMQMPAKPQPKSGLQAGAALAGSAQRIGQGAKTVANAVGNAPMLRNMLPKVDPAWGNTFWSGGKGSPPPVPQQTPPNMLQKASAFEFGQWLKQAAIDWNAIGEKAKQVWNDPTTQAGVQYGGIGAGLGGLYGLINPGEYEDEYGNVRRRGRLMGALRGAAGGGLLGGAVGAGAQEGRYQYLKHLANNAYGAAGGQIGPAAAPGMGMPTNRAGMQEYVEQFAPEHLKTSPLGSLRDAYSQYVAPTMARFKPKKPVGQAPNTGVDPQSEVPGLTLTNPATGAPVGG